MSIDNHLRESRAGRRGKRLRACAAFLLALGACASALAGQPDLSLLQHQVEEAERAFARTMAERDYDGFVTFLAEEAVFFSGNTPLRGKQTVAEAWKPYFDGEIAPFSWDPELVVVLESGTLALSSGPVFDPHGERIATFNSVWLLESGGQWRIILDKGSQDCAE